MDLSIRSAFSCIAVVLAVQLGLSSAAKTSAQKDSCFSVEGVLAAHTELSAFSQALQQANLTGKIGNIALNATVFAPSNEALQKVPDLQGLQESSAHNATWVLSALLNHIVPYKISGATRHPAQYDTLAGQEVTVQVGPSNVSNLMLATATGNRSALSLGSYHACKAVVFVIDSVLLPQDTLEPLSAAALLANATATLSTFNTTSSRGDAIGDVTLMGRDATGALPIIPRALVSAPAQEVPGENDGSGGRKGVWSGLTNAVAGAKMMWSQSAPGEAKTTLDSGVGDPTSLQIINLDAEKMKQLEKYESLTPPMKQVKTSPGAETLTAEELDGVDPITGQPVIRSTAGMHPKVAHVGLASDHTANLGGAADKASQTLLATGSSGRSKTPSSKVAEARQKVLEQVKADSAESKLKGLSSGVRDQHFGHSHEDRKEHLKAHKHMVN